MKKIQFMDTSFRDGFQSVIGARVIAKDFLPAISAAMDAGTMYFEVAGGARFQSPFFYCGENAFDMMDEIRKTVGPDVNLQSLARGVNVVGLDAQSSEMIDLHAKMFKKHGVTTVRNFDALNDIRNLEYSGNCVYNAGLRHEATITLMALPPGVKDTYPHSAKFYCDILEQILNSSMKFHSLCFKDASGTCTPATLRETVKRCREMLDAAGRKDCPIHVHTHDTADMGVACYMAAVEAGAEIIDLSMSPMSGGTGQPDILTMWHAFKGTEFTLDIDYAKILKAEETFENCMEKYMLPPEAKTTNQRITLSPMPGGALTANTQMMRDNNCLDRFPEIINAMREVVEKGGYGTSVTPVSQFYFQQAFANVFQGPWKKITAGYGKMVLGYFGKTPGTPDPEIVKLASEQLGLQPTTENARELKDKDPKYNRPYYEERLRTEGIEVTDENVFIAACCEDKGIDFLKGKRPMGVRYKEEKPAAKAAEKTAGPAVYTVTVNGKPYRVDVTNDTTVAVNGKPFSVSLAEGAAAAAAPAAAAPAAGGAAAGKEVTAPMPGKILRIEASVGQAVKEGDVLIIIEAMKMEQNITAPAAGTVVSIDVAAGDVVNTGDVVAHI